MTVVEAPNEIRACYQRLKDRCAFALGGKAPEVRVVHSGGRSGMLANYPLSDEGAWAAFDESRPECFQILLGTARSSDRCVVEINAPREGRSHAFGGFFLRETGGRVFLARSSGLSQRTQWKRFLDQAELPTTELDDQPVALVGELGGDDLLQSLARFAQSWQEFKESANTRPVGNAWRAYLFPLLQERAESAGVDLVLPLYWKGHRREPVDGLVVGDEIRVRVSQAMLDRLDALRSDYADGLKTDRDRKVWHRSVEVIRANVGKTISLNKYGTGYVVPLNDRRTTISMNVYLEFEVDPKDQAFDVLLTDAERRLVEGFLQETGRETLPINRLGHLLSKVGGEPGEAADEDGAEEDESDEAEEDRVWTRQRNVIFFGPPGTGKSHQVQGIVTKHLAAKPERVKRVTFHPEYSYFDFVGSYRPAVGWLKTSAQFTDADGVQHDREPRTYYRFEPGPFSHALALAAGQKDEPVVLIVEEINRGNCAAIFGDVFQLLDRVNDARRPEREGWSEYAIVPGAEWAAWLEAQVPKGSEVFDPKTRQLRLPGNLYLYATMNTSDQSLFPMDTAFRRRWGMSYAGVDTHAQPTSKVPLHAGDEAGVQWIALMRALNKEIVDHTRTDDKQMGPWFIRPPAGETVVDRLEFKSKVLYYLWATVFRDRPARVFHQDVDTYEALLARYDKGQHVFQTSVLTAVGVSADPHSASAPASQA